MSRRDMAVRHGPLTALLASGIGFVLAFVLGGVVLLLLWFDAFARGINGSVGSSIAGIMTVAADDDVVSSTFEPGAFALLFGIGLAGAVVGCLVGIVLAKRRASA